MIRAMIFDMDGVISDTQVFYSETESEVLARYGVMISPDDISRIYSGVSYSHMLPELFGQFGIAADIKTVIQELHEAFDSRVIRSKIIPVEGARELIDLLHGRGFRLAVASASRRSFIEYVLVGLDLMDKFQVIASAYEVARGKPEPDVFLLAAERLGVLPEECMVIEDGVNGMIGAKSAGMKCIGFVKEKNTEIYPADLLVTSLREITPEVVSSL